jgi:ubiquinone/menaquinone biosynthesis C-methylase UbiE
MHSLTGDEKTTKKAYDVSEELLKVARERMPNQTFIQQSVYDLSFPEKFDGFWASAVLLHIPKIRINEALRSIKSVIKPGAIGFISLKAGEGEQVTKHKLNDSKGLERLFVYWSKEDFTEVLNKNSFEILFYGYKPVSKSINWHMFIVRNQKTAGTEK